MTYWIQDAVRRPRAPRRKARVAYETPLEFEETHAHAPGLAGRRARFALIVQGRPVPAEPDARESVRRRRRAILPSAAAGPA